MGNEARFSDQELTALRDDFEKHKVAQENSLRALATMVEENTKATQRIALAVEKQAESTAEIVQLYTDFKGAARLGIGLRKFLAWVAGLGAAGAAIVAGILHLIDWISPGPGG